MIVCAPDMTADVAARFGVEPCLIVSLSRENLDNYEAGKMWRLADIGLATARSGGFSLARYLTLIRRAKAHWAVVPDVFGDFKVTLTNWQRYSFVIAKFAAPILVAQEFHRAGILGEIVGLAQLGAIERVALPMRLHPDVSCSRDPRLCAERAERALRALCVAVRHIHLLGPPLKAVRLLLNALKQCEGQGSVISFDTAAYRRAPNNELKQRLGGRWMPRNKQEAVVMLEAWLRQALLR